MSAAEMLATAGSDWEMPNAAGRRRPPPAVGGGGRGLIVVGDRFHVGIDAGEQERAVDVGVQRADQARERGFALALQHALRHR